MKCALQKLSLVKARRLNDNPPDAEVTSVPFPGEVQRVDHRHVPHASSFGEGTGEPGDAAVQAGNAGESRSKTRD